MLMQFDGAAAAANVTIDAATWQIDYQARLKGMDEDHRLSCLDNYGHTAFVDGFDVTRHEVDQTKYLIAPGVAYVGGLRIQNALSTLQTVDSKPTTLWIDVYRDGTALSKHENLFQIVATTDDLVDYTDNESRPHYVAKLARIEADGSVVDLRVKGGLAEHVADSDPHEMYTKKSNVYTKEEVGNLLAATGLGNNQSWQTAELTNTSASFDDGTPKHRALGVTYTNNTGRAIMVSVIYAGGSQNAYLYCDDVVIDNQETSPGTCQVVVPDGSTYRATTSGTLVSWHELR